MRQKAIPPIRFGRTATRWLRALVVVLKQAGRDLSRENIMKVATNLPDTTTLPMVLPEIKISSSPTDYRPMKSMRLVQFDGKMYKLVPE